MVLDRVAWMAHRPLGSTQRHKRDKAESALADDFGRIDLAKLGKVACELSRGDVDGQAADEQASTGRLLLNRRQWLVNKGYWRRRHVPMLDMNRLIVVLLRLDWRSLQLKARDRGSSSRRRGSRVRNWSRCRVRNRSRHRSVTSRHRIVQLVLRRLLLRDNIPTLLLLLLLLGDNIRTGWWWRLLLMDNIRTGCLLLLRSRPTRIVGDRGPDHGSSCSSCCSIVDQEA